jgi:hypothetical protein
MDRRRGPAVLLQPPALVRTWRRFGVTGPVYEIVDVGRMLGDGDCLMRVRAAETGEELDYRFANILDDPRDGRVGPGFVKRCYFQMEPVGPSASFRGRGAKPGIQTRR